MAFDMERCYPYIPSKYIDQSEFNQTLHEENDPINENEEIFGIDPLSEYNQSF